MDRGIAAALGKVVLGWHLDNRDVPLCFPPEVLAYHTAVLAQSGSGKSCFLGRLVEEVLLKTSGRALVIDMNGDFRKFDRVDERAWEMAVDPKTGKRTSPRWLVDLADCPLVFERLWNTVRLRHVAERAPSGEAEDSCIPRWEQLSIDDQLALLKVGASDPGRAGLEGVYQALYGAKTCPVDLPQFAQDYTGRGPHAPRYGDLIAQGLEAALDRPWRAQGAVNRLLGSRPNEWDVGILDVPSLGTDRTRVIDDLLYRVREWAHQQWDDVSRERCPEGRVPLFIIVDEAHNLVSDDPEHIASRLVKEFAAEGRKYGLFVVLASQRPSKMPVGLLQECENVCLLRLQSNIDHEVAAKAWGIPPEVVARTRYFEPGQGLLSGRWVVSTPAFAAARRRTCEGGASLDKSRWARPREAVLRALGEPSPTPIPHEWTPRWSLAPRLRCSRL